MKNCVCGEPEGTNNDCERCGFLTEIDRLKKALSFREAEAVAAVNQWWMACEVVGIPFDSSGGRFRDKIKQLKDAKAEEEGCNEDEQ